jgi:hypothetical protein
MAHSRPTGAAREWTGPVVAVATVVTGCANGEVVRQPHEHAPDV